MVGGVSNPDFNSLSEPGFSELPDYQDYRIYVYCRRSAQHTSKIRDEKNPVNPKILKIPVQTKNPVNPKIRKSENPGSDKKQLKQKT